MKKYWVRVTRDNNAKIASLYSPDFKCELLKGKDNIDTISVSDNFRTYAFELLTDRFKDRIHHLSPKTLKQLKDIPLTDLQHWECIMILSPKKRGFFSKGLPIIGQLSNAIAILAGAFITFMALRVASSHNENNNVSESNALSISGAVFGSIMAFIMYIFSGASNMLAGIGSWMDTSISKLLKRAPVNNSDPKEPARVENESFMPTRQTSAKILLALGTVGSVFANTVITSVSQYQETNLLTDRFLDLYPHLTSVEREQYYELLWWLVVVTYVSTMAFSGLAFQGGFAEQLLKKVSDKLLGAPVDIKETNSEKAPLLDNDSVIADPSTKLTSDALQTENEESVILSM